MPEPQLNAHTENPSGQGLLADDTEQLIVFYHSLSFSKICEFPARCLTEPVREDRAQLEIFFVYIVADKVGVPYSWVNLQLPEQLVHWLRIGCEIQVICTITHPLVNIYEHSTAHGNCDVCGDINREDRPWHYNVAACTECNTSELCCLCRVVLPRVAYTFPYTEQTVLCLLCVSQERSTEDIHLSAIQQARLAALDQYWEHLYGEEYWARRGSPRRILG